jgi:DNA-directed RNA polymerases I and III subunit RPAC1
MDPGAFFSHFAVYSRDIEWTPHGKQVDWFKDNPIRPVHDDILIAKLRPGQVLPKREMRLIPGN